jgi:putative Mg2+ transporter-C (MgtC) family protein
VGEDVAMRALDPLAPPFWIGVGIAVMCGGLVGLEHQFRGKAVGVRTSILICLSTSVFVHLGAAYAGEGGDPTRVLGQVVTGVGFLGAGVILARGGVVTGVTTAALIWILAAIGAAIGLRKFGAALALSIVTVGVVTGVRLLEATFRRLRSGAYAEESGLDEGDES